MSDGPDTSFGHFDNAEQNTALERCGRAALGRRQAALDALLAPLQEPLIARADIQPGEQVLDIGCGCGATTIVAAAKVGPGGSVLGLDVSAAMLIRANELAPGMRRSASSRATRWCITSRPPPHPRDLPAGHDVLRRSCPCRLQHPHRAALGRAAGIACWRDLRDNPWALEPLQAAYDTCRNCRACAAHAG